MDRRRSRVQYDDAEPLPIGQADAYESERWIRGQDRWTEDRRSWSQDTHNRPRERSREAQRRPSWRDRDEDIYLGAGETVPLGKADIMMTMRGETAGALGVAMTKNRSAPKTTGEAHESEALCPSVPRTVRTHVNPSATTRAKIPPSPAIQTMPRPTRWRP